MYKIRWKGYDAKQDTWEDHNSLSCPDLLEMYNTKVYFKRSGTKNRHFHNLIAFFSMKSLSRRKGDLHLRRAGEDPRDQQKARQRQRIPKALFPMRVKRRKRTKPTMMGRVMSMTALIQRKKDQRRREEEEDPREQQK